MLRLKEKAEPEAVDALTVCDDLRREGELEEAGGDGLRALAALARCPPRPTCATTRASSRTTRCCGRLLVSRARHPGERLHRRGRPARRWSSRPSRRSSKRRPRRGQRRARPSRTCSHEELDKLERLSREGRRRHRHALGLPRPRRAHRRLPARQPDRAGRAALDGQVGAGHQHGRERRAWTTARPVAHVLAGDGGGRAGPALHRLPGRISGDVAAQGPRQARPLAEGGQGHREAGHARRCSSTTPATSGSSSCAPRPGGCTSATTSAC